MPEDQPAKQERQQAPQAERRADPTTGVRPAPDVHDAVEALKAGLPVVFPTETVYGIGMSVRHSASPDPLYRIKRRDRDKPIAWLVSDASALDRYGLRVPAWARTLAERFWPGPLTIIVPTSAAVPSRWCGRDRTVALRVPASLVAQQILAGVGGPVATSSANVQGRIPPRAASHVAKSIRQQVAAVVDGPMAEVGSPSTIVLACDDTPRIVRLGPVSPEQIREACDIEPQVVSAADTYDDVGGLARVAKEALAVPSADGAGVQRGFVWGPAGALEGERPPVATVQVVHGMCEFVDRYDAFARFLASHGYVVYGCDLPGHGDTAPSPDLWGHLPAGSGADLLVDGTRAVMRAAAARFGDVPRFVFAHSMGTFVARTLLARDCSRAAAAVGVEGETGTPSPVSGLAGVILSGTGQPSFFRSHSGTLVARLGTWRHGDAYRSARMDALANGHNNDEFQPVRTPADWLSSDEETVDAYLDDPRCTFTFTSGAYEALGRLTIESTSRRAARHLPHDLPMLLIGGGHDPVGEDGEGVRRAARMYGRAGLEDVEVRLFPDDRHEVLNERDRDAVYMTILGWLEGHLTCRRNAMPSVPEQGQEGEGRQ